MLSCSGSVRDFERAGGKGESARYPVGGPHGVERVVATSFEKRPKFVAYTGAMTCGFRRQNAETLP